MIKAKIVADSINEFGNRITTMIVTMPRIILAEFNTHRMFSRNSASSRAIPFEKMVKSIQETPFIPIAWQKDHKGMQGVDYFPIAGGFTAEEGIGSIYFDNLWLIARDNAIRLATDMNKNNLTKQLCNRLLEPFMYHTCIVSATEWENFFHLRCPKYLFTNDVDEDGKFFRSRKDVIEYAENQFIGQGEYLKYHEEIKWLQANKGAAEIHMMALAEAMWDAYNESTPKQLKANEWHIPFGDKINNEKLFEELGYEDPIERDKLKIKISTVMCARVSYTTIGTEQSEWTYDKYIQKYDELVSANPIHASPLEHCAKAMNADEFVSGINGNLETSGYYGDDHFKEGHSVLIEKYVTKYDYHAGWSGNFRGFIQLRKTIPNENVINGN